MSQLRRHSLLESLINVMIGFAVSVLANAIVLPLFGLTVTTGESVGIALIFTLISIVRSYILRRIFNWWS